MSDKKIVFLRRPAVEAITGLGRSSIYKGVKDGTFPKPIPISERAVAWLESDIDEWQSALVAAARDAQRG